MTAWRPVSHMIALACATLLAAAGLPTTASAQAPRTDWNTAQATTEAGHLLGNPDAATTLVTFVSYTCPHCAEFELQSDAPLRIGYIRSGKVSLELRHLIRNPIDLAAALAAECGPPGRFFARHHALLRAQGRWLGKARAATPAQQQRWTTGPAGARMRAIASDLDFNELLEPQGIGVAQLDRCLSDEARARTLAATSQAQSERFAITGTPSFLVDGKLLEGVHSWAALQPALDARL